MRATKSIRACASLALGRFIYAAVNWGILASSILRWGGVVRWSRIRRAGKEEEEERGEAKEEVAAAAEVLLLVGDARATRTLATTAVEASRSARPSSTVVRAFWDPFFSAVERPAARVWRGEACAGPHTTSTRSRN